MDGCLACDLAEGIVELPGDVIHETAEWDAGVLPPKSEIEAFVDRARAVFRR